MISFWISVVPPKIDWTRPSPGQALGTHNRGGGRGLGVPVCQSGRIWSARAAAFACCDKSGDPAPWDRLAALQLPGPGRGPDDDSEPAATDVPAVDADVESGELIAAQLPQVLVMHDGGEDSQMGLWSGEPSRGNQDLGPGEDAHHDSMGT
jgi:hypothetical protein